MAHSKVKAALDVIRLKVSFRTHTTRGSPLFLGHEAFKDGVQMNAKWCRGLRVRKDEWRSETIRKGGRTFLNATCSDCLRKAQNCPHCLLLILFDGYIFFFLPHTNCQLPPFIRRPVRIVHERSQRTMLFRASSTRSRLAKRRVQVRKANKPSLNMTILRMRKKSAGPMCFSYQLEEDMVQDGKRRHLLRRGGARPPK